MYVQLLIIILGFLALKWYPQVSTEAYQAKQHKKYIIFMMALLILQSGLRHLAVGPDTYQYYINYYLDVERRSWQSLCEDCMYYWSSGEGKDPGYRLLLKAIQYVLPTFQLYLIGLASFVFYGLGKLLNRYTKNNYEVLVALALYQCLYYSFFSITGLRQTMATGFLFLAIPFVEQRKFRYFILYVLFAATQHKSALLFIPFYFLPMFKNSKMLLVGSLLSFVPMWVLGSAFASYLVTGSTFEQYSTYLEDTGTSGALGFSVFIVLLGVILIRNNEKILLKYPEHSLIIKAIAVAIFLTPLTAISPANMRIVQYYSIYALMGLPIVIQSLSKRQSYLINNVVILLLVLYMIMKNEQYAFFWQEMSFGINYQ